MAPMKTPRREAQAGLAARMQVPGAVQPVSVPGQSEDRVLPAAMLHRLDSGIAARRLLLERDFPRGYC
jgi:hypothetical protein